MPAIQPVTDETEVFLLYLEESAFNAINFARTVVCSETVDAGAKEKLANAAIDRFPQLVAQAPIDAKMLAADILHSVILGVTVKEKLAHMVIDHLPQFFASSVARSNRVAAIILQFNGFSVETKEKLANAATDHFSQIISGDPGAAVHLVENILRSTNVGAASKSRLADKIMGDFAPYMRQPVDGQDLNDLFRIIIRASEKDQADFPGCTGRVQGGLAVSISAPGGSEGRISFAVRKGDKTVFLVGCFRGTEKSLLAESKCLVPAFDGTRFEPSWREALWDKFYTGAPQRQRRSVEQYKIVKRA